MALYRTKRRMSKLKKRLLQITVAALLFLAVYLFANYIYPRLAHTQPFPNDDRMQIHFIDVGQGDATLIVTPGGQTILIDAGPNSAERNLLAYLNRCEIQNIDYMILTHPHEDHIGGADYILSHIPTEQVMISPAQSDTTTFEHMLNAIERSGSSLSLAQVGKTVELDDVTLTVLAPLNEDEEELNNASIVCRIDFGNCRIMMTGDAEKAAEEAILSHWDPKELDCDLLKLGHHGSSTSNTDAFLDALTPQIAVACCGLGNEYGHPHIEVRRALEKRGIQLWRTDRDGSVVFLCNGNDFEYWETNN